MRIGDLLGSAELSDIPLVYKVREPEILEGKPWIIFVFGPSGAGKDTLAKPLVEKGLLNVAITATSRAKRPIENENVYVWMRKKKIRESDALYVDNLIEEYGLMEHNLHHNAVYGVPKSSVEKALKKGPVLLVIEINGVETISRIMKDQANLLKVFIAPESLEQVKKRIQGRGDETVRFEKSKDEIQRAPGIAHFYLLNKDGQIKQAQKSLEELIKRYI